jgi:peptide subunit release factor 1 (eRF1)
MAATSVSWDTLRELAGFRSRAGVAVSCYVDLDPQDAPTPGDVRTRMRALIDEAGKRAEAGRARWTHKQLMSLRGDLERIEGYFDTEFARDGVRGVAVFAAAGDDFWRPLPLAGAVLDTVKVDTELCVAPLVPLAADGPSALVAVVGRERGDLFELRAGRLEPVTSRFDEQPRRHDQGGRSQANYRRHLEDLASKHLRTVAEEVGRALRQRRGTDLVVACAEETRAEFLELLSRDARAAFAGWVAVEAHATGNDLLEPVRPVLEERRAKREIETVMHWHDALGQSGRASVGWGPTVEAASDGRVDLLLYEPNANQPVERCPSCRRLQLVDGECPLDGADLEHCDDGLDLVLHRTLERGGTALPVTTRDDLAETGGIGALLRF